MPRKKKEEISEDWCFCCKDGGSLILCEHKDCLKAYHPKCVGKDDSFLNSEESWRCDWHSCFICKKAAKFHCICCPNAICGHCLCEAEFVVVRGIKGFCNNCLKFALLWEEKKNIDSDGGKVNFLEKETCEFLFMDYWEIIKKNEGLTLEHLQKASVSLKTGKNLKIVDNLDEVGRSDKDLLNLTNYEDWEWEVVEDYAPSRKGKKRKSNAFKKGRQCKMQPKKQKFRSKEFIGWGSKPLIEFLTSRGIDTSVELTAYDVVGTVSKYIDEEKLAHPTRKKMIVCDEKLSTLLGKKVVNKHRICNLLEEHYAKNHEASDDDWCISELMEGRPLIKSRLKKKRSREEKGQIEQREVAKSCMASLVPENIMLAFLRKSIVVELLKQPDTFEDKVIGSFLRVKSDPDDYMQQYSHQLVEVTGIRKLPTKGANVDILFQVSSMPLDISFEMLSDIDFTKDECDQLSQKVKDGVHKKLTVVELKQKASQLREDITKHWIVKELARLKNLIDRAKEKGRRGELMEYTEKRKLLLLPDEQLRLMNEIPEVIAEDLNLNNESRNFVNDTSYEDLMGREKTGDARDSEAVTSSVSAGSAELRTIEVKEETQEIKGGNVSDKAVTVTSSVSAGNGDLGTFEVNEQTQEIKEGDASDSGANISFDSSASEDSRKSEARELIQGNIAGDARESEAVTSSVFAGSAEFSPLEMKEPTQEIKGGNVSDKAATVTSSVSAVNGDSRAVEAKEQTQETKEGDACDNGANIPFDSSANEDCRKFQARELVQDNVAGIPEATETIYLSSDDDDDKSKIKKLKSTESLADEIETAEWYCMGPTGDKRGPCLKSALKKWKALSPSYAAKFKVWRKDQSSDNAIPLSEFVG
ncbi:zinc finger CCCH domain-containing protein 19-like [Silene latifolia]|uniref:zinc finger CCCH domain-containing protein 19-like n=1 Tax=Silene latifolia TaxID=37657 RepID=UPI003D7758DA